MRLYVIERRCRHRGAVVNSRLRTLVDSLAQEQKIPGSSTRKGCLYHDLPLPETGLASHRRYSIERLIKLKRQLPIYGSRILDLGCSCGGLSLGTALLGATEVVGWDHDPTAIAIAKVLAEKYRIGNARFFCGAIGTAELPDADVLLWLSQWMWLVKQYGLGRAKEMLFEIPKQCGARFMAFESAASDGLAGIPGTTQREIESFLRECAPYRRVENIGPFGDAWRKPGQERMVFLCSEPLWQWKGWEAVVTRTGWDRVTKEVRPRCREHIAIEAECLRRLEPYPWFPKLIKEEKDCITMEWAGWPVEHAMQFRDMPKILAALREKGITHRDICPENLLWRDGRLFLIDFSWAMLDGKETSSPLPPRLGRGYYEHGVWDDARAAARVQESVEKGKSA